MIDNKDFQALFEGTKSINDSLKSESVFRLNVGEGCRVRQDYVDQLQSNESFKMMWIRVNENEYRSLDSNGKQDTLASWDILQFSEECWEKI
jgi:hypothetical protein